MGSSSSTEVVKHVESEESKRAKLLDRLEKQLEELKSEVTKVEPSIKENIKETISQEEDALLMRYSQLTDKEKITQDIQKVFGDFPLLSFLVDTATRLVGAMTSSKEMTEILRWQERKMVKRVGNQVFGIEAHYKVKIMEESKGNVFSSSKDTVVLIAYKCIAHSMDLNPADIPDAEEYKQITF